MKKKLLTLLATITYGSAGFAGTIVKEVCTSRIDVKQQSNKDMADAYVELTIVFDDGKITRAPFAHTNTTYWDSSSRKEFSDWIATQIANCRGEISAKRIAIQNCASERVANPGAGRAETYQEALDNCERLGQ